MLHKLFLNSIITFLIIETINPLVNQASHKNNLIKKFCIASVQSKLKLIDKQKSDEISHFTCTCFFKKYRSGSSIKNSRIYCRDKAEEEFNL